MALPIPIQMVRPATYGVGRRRYGRNTDQRPARLQDEATRAWNFFTALYYKAGGTPWRIARETEEYTTCYVGVSFYRRRIVGDEPAVWIQWDSEEGTARRFGLPEKHEH